MTTPWDGEKTPITNRHTHSGSKLADRARAMEQRCRHAEALLAAVVPAIMDDDGEANFKAIEAHLAAARQEDAG